MKKIEQITLDVNYAVADVVSAKNPNEISTKALQAKYKVEKLLAETKRLIDHPHEE